ncbi:6443_t:CDS:2 [Funneliformis geosporum]|uniref:17201_t:CDS:1 n=1 Tax=Funneliformis geosporum TaxID=1117311 RepID=A0A9W4WXJ4_9GLOM|nr:17201_t:CDS:2 [Funneliformis geosporum]CAI2186754.1 6443_t:CDS:2 [Funneliformis geosporum]
MDEEQWAILFDEEYIRTEDYRRNSKTLDEFNRFLEELPSLLKKKTSVALNHCLRCRKITIIPGNTDEDLQCFRVKYSHQVERILTVDALRDTKLNLMTLEILFNEVGLNFEVFNQSMDNFLERYKVYICKRCDALSATPEHTGYRNPGHDQCDVLTNLKQLREIEIEFDLLNLFEIFKSCLDIHRPNRLSKKWDLFSDEIPLVKRDFYYGYFGISEWTKYIKIEDYYYMKNDTLLLYMQFLRDLPKRLQYCALYKCVNCNRISSSPKFVGLCYQTNQWISDDAYLPQIPHKNREIDNVEVFIKAKVSLNSLSRVYAQRYNEQSIHLNNFLSGLLGFSYFIKTCEIFHCTQCGTFSALKQGGSLCRKPYRDHAFERINDILTFYDEYINLFDLQYVLQTALNIAYPDKPVYLPKI